MSLQPGSRVGPYEIVAPLGAGGMGEVYRARDLRLGRDVAIKILPGIFSADPDRLRRFEQEARAAAMLNHPNILSVYDIGTQGGWPYIVSELLDGETLRTKAARPMAVRRAVDCALQLARGLAAAHDKGIVHRDLKPENVFTTTDGRVKVLDFGLAKLTAHPAAAGSATTMVRDTEPGMVMGTVGYMSPEQVRGEPADHRSDIFAFGAILYEILSGTAAFRRPSAPESMTAILNDDPPELAATVGAIAPGLSRIVDRCLQKNPAARFQSAHDLAFAIEQLSTASGTAPVVGVAPKRSWRWLPWALFGAAAAGCVALSLVAVNLSRRPEPQAQPIRFQIDPPGSASITANGNFVAVSPDGRRIVFVVSGSAGQMLWIQALDSLTARPLAGTERAAVPFWSPDSRWIGFFADGRLKKVSPDGSAPAQPVAEFTGLVTGAAWSPGGTILVSTLTEPIRRLSDSGGGFTSATTLDPARRNELHLYPQFLPDGDHFLFCLRTADRQQNGIYVASVSTPGMRKVAGADSRFAYVPPGYLVFARDGLLMFQPFDANTATATGDATATAERVEQFPDTGNFILSASPTGVLVFRGFSDSAMSRLTWFTRNGAPLSTLGNPDTYRNPRLSPDGRRIAVEMVDSAGNRDVWLVDAARGTQSRFTFDAGRDAAPVWSPDGRRIAWQANGSLRAKAVDGGEEVTLWKEAWIPDDWSSADSLVMHPTQPRQIWRLPIAGSDRAPTVIVTGRTLTTHARLSPDGRWIAFTTMDSGRFEIEVQSATAEAPRSRLSTDGGIQPKWRRDEKELFYLAIDGTLMTVPLTLGDGVQADRPQPLFRTGIPTMTGNVWHQYDVTPDGQRFLLNVPISPGSSPVTVIVNWPALINRP